MSNLKKHFFHISKSWFSVCTFIFLLAVCVGLVIHITNKKENATCSNSEAPIVSNGNPFVCIVWTGVSKYKERNSANL